jgi:hypothetical protein
MDICDKKANQTDSLFYVTGLSVARNDANLKLSTDNV